MTDVVFNAEDLLDYLNYSLKFVYSKIREASPTKPKFEIEIEHRHRTWSLPVDRLIAALEAIGTGKGLTDIISVPCTEKYKFEVERALIEAQNYLTEDFHVDHSKIADAAFYRFRIRRPSERMDECAKALLAELRKTEK
jgi:hypothetical protein